MMADNKKFDVLVEALWEVVKDYIDKWEKTKDEFDVDYDYGWDDDY
jgi:frataxin-like iron-binding protein CyaY